MRTFTLAVVMVLSGAAAGRLQAQGAAAGTVELAARELAPGKAFSVQPPQDWKVTKVDAESAIAAARGDGLNFKARHIGAGLTMGQFIDASMNALKAKYPDFKIFSKTPFTTKSGIKGQEVAMQHSTQNGTQVRQIMFFLEGKANGLIFMACGVRADLFTPEIAALARTVASTIAEE